MAIFGKLERYSNTGLLIMRAGLGVMMIIHGLPKITGGPAKWEQLGHAMHNLHIDFAPTLWGFMAALAETVGGLFCILGLWFRVATLLLVFTMLVASMEHFAGGGGIKEAGHALELMFAFIGLTFLGPGMYSVDRS
jgi:putative oxidoreductase